MFLPASDSDIKGIIRQNRRVVVKATGNHSGSKRPDNVFNNYEANKCWYSSLTDQVIELTISFRSSKIFLTNYSIKSPCYDCSNYLPKSWVLEGYDEEKWDTISRVEESGLSMNCTVKTFVADYYAKAYKTFKFTQTGPNYARNAVFAIQALDFFGILIEKKQTIKMLCKYCILNLAFMMQMIVSLKL